MQRYLTYLRFLAPHLQRQILPIATLPFTYLRVLAPHLQRQILPIPIATLPCISTRPCSSSSEASDILILIIEFHDIVRTSTNRGRATKKGAFHFSLLPRGTISILLYDVHTTYTKICTSSTFFLKDKKVKLTTLSKLTILTEMLHFSFIFLS